MTALFAEDHPPALLAASTADSVGTRVRQLVDHSRGCVRATSGFSVYGRRWLAPWLAYCASPVINRIAPGRVNSFSQFSARTGRCDLDAFANIFGDYSLPRLRSAAREVDLILDVGANVGAFSLLMRTLAPALPIIAVEPESENVAFLRQQPFANTLDIRHGAVATEAGTARLRRGINSVTHHLDFDSPVDESETVSTFTLDSLCHAPALVKMDIEGGELAVLKQGLPRNVRHLVLEWHYAGTPADVLRGRWQHVSTDLHGATTWWWSR